jgi:hypothetical protein
MKTIKLKHLIMLLCICLSLGVGCEKEESLNEQDLFKLHYAIQNEKGEKATRLKEGENFYIYFSIENISNKDISIYDHHLFGNNELFNVYKYDSNTNDYIIIGNMIEIETCLDIYGCLVEAHSINELKVPWAIEEDIEFGIMCCNYKMKKQPILSVGKYIIKYTGHISYSVMNDNDIVEYFDTDQYSIKVEFEIIK